MNNKHLQLVWLMTAALNVAACSENNETSINHPHTGIEADEIEMLVSAIEAAQNSSTTLEKMDGVKVQIPLGENGDIKNIWVKIDLQKSTESRLVGTVLDVPDSWQIIQTGQPISIEDLSSIVAWQRLDGTAN